jgi:carboxymethylenebutenolidase
LRILKTQSKLSPALAVCDFLRQFPRMSKPATAVTLPVADGTTMQAWVAEPDGAPAKAPGLLLLQEAFGVNAHIRDLAQRWAAEGYVVIAPEFFHRSAPPGFTCAYTDFAKVRPLMEALTETGMEHDLRAARDFLQAHPRVRRGVIGAIGFCLGGRLAFLANAILPLRAQISFYGGRIAPDLIKRAPQLAGPALYCWGGLDQHIPPEQIRAVTDALRQAGKSFINVEFSDADHGFYCDDRPAYQPAAARQAHALVQAFLREHLGA